MKKLLIILSIAILATSCKKEKLYNCLEGKWYIESTNTLYYDIDANGHESIHNYNIDKDGYVYQNGIQVMKFTCNGNNLTVCNDVQFGCDSNLAFLVSKYTKH